jgi:AcrR family transcriptional regulator
MKQRLKPEIRRDQILAAALVLAERDGYHNITRDAIAERASCSTGLVTRYFSTMLQLKRAVMRAAVKQEIVRVVAQGMVDKNQYAMRAPPALRERALATISG